MRVEYIYANCLPYFEWLLDRVACMDDYTKINASTFSSQWYVESGVEDPVFYFSSVTVVPIHIYTGCRVEVLVV